MIWLQILTPFFIKPRLKSSVGTRAKDSVYVYLQTRIGTSDIKLNDTHSLTSSPEFQNANIHHTSLPQHRINIRPLNNMLLSNPLCGDHAFFYPSS